MSGSGSMRSADFERWRRAASSRLLLTSVALLAPLLTFSCRSDEERPVLVAARFADSNYDGEPQSGEKIVLTFSTEVILVKNDPRDGIVLHAGPGEQLGSYRVARGATDVQLEVDSSSYFSYRRSPL